jgi:hypothetical protein
MSITSPLSQSKKGFWAFHVWQRRGLEGGSLRFLNMCATLMREKDLEETVLVRPGFVGVVLRGLGFRLLVFWV